MPGRMKRLCGATTKRGTPCGCKAMGNGLCRFHGGEGMAPEDEARALRARARLKQEAERWLRERGKLK